MSSPLARDLAEALDPVVFARRLGIEPDPWQADFLRSNARQTVLLAHRQAGKSLITAIAALHQAYFYPRSLTLILSPSLRQSQELGRKIRDFQALLGEADSTSIPTETESALQLTLKNKSRLVCLAGRQATARGYSAPALIVIDEAAQVADELYEAARPMLAVSSGRLILLSTPFGRRGFLWKVWSESSASLWRKVKIAAADSTRISAAWLQREREAVPDWVYKQEWDVEFVESDSQLWAHELVMAALSDEVSPLLPNVPNVAPGPQLAVGVAP